MRHFHSSSTEARQAHAIPSCARRSAIRWAWAAVAAVCLVLPPSRGEGAAFLYAYLVYSFGSVSDTDFGLHLYENDRPLDTHLGELTGIEMTADFDGAVVRRTTDAIRQESVYEVGETRVDAHFEGWPTAPLDFHAFRGVFKPFSFEVDDRSQSSPGAWANGHGTLSAELARFLGVQRKFRMDSYFLLDDVLSTPGSERALRAACCSSIDLTLRPVPAPPGGVLTGLAIGASALLSLRRRKRRLAR